MRMTLDYDEDFQFFKGILAELHHPGQVFTLREVLELVDRRPDLAKLGQARSDEWSQAWAAFDVTVDAERS